jgi:hypothetical protein
MRSKPKIEGICTEYFTTTHAPKLKKLFNIKEIMNERSF